MSEYINNELIENTYLFCIKRVANSDTAKDLAHDILLEALKAVSKGKKFTNFYGWYWRMAHNKYANYMEYKKTQTLPIEVAGGVAAEICQPIEQIINDEKISYLNYSLSRLASDYREIIIRFYLKEQLIKQISQELKIPEGTVKRRLFDAKKKVKERFDKMRNIGTLSYAPAEIDWFWGYRCREAAGVLDNQKIAHQICVLCGKEPKNINEISDEMGVAPIYVEPIMEQLLKVKLVVPYNKKKYISNFGVFPKQAYMQAQSVANYEFRENGYFDKVNQALENTKDEILKFDFYGNDFNYKYLKWIFYVIAGYQIGYLANEKYLEKYKGKYKDEGERDYRITMQYSNADENIDYPIQDETKTAEWSCLTQKFMSTRYGKIEFVNDYQCAPFPSEGEEFAKGRDLWVNGDNITLLMELAENSSKKLNTYEEEMVACFIKNGLVEKKDNGYKVLLPIFKRDVFEKIATLIKEAVRNIAYEYSDCIAGKVEKILLPYVRKELMSNFIYWDMKMFFQPISSLFYYGIYDSNDLEIPKDYEHSAAGLYLEVK